MKKKTVFISIVLSLLVLFCSCGSSSDAGQSLESEITETQEVPRIDLPSGRSFNIDAEHISIPGIRHDDASALVEALKQMPNLSYVNLGEDADDGSSLTPQDIIFLQDTFPNIDFQYVFRLGNVIIPMDETYLDLNHIKMTDNGEKIRGILQVLDGVTYLDMDFCGVPDEIMEQIRDENPNTDVIWRIWFGNMYSVRTDAERIVASNPDVDCLSGEDVQVLKYCTKCRFLDLGHNEIDDISFIANMPDLEAVIISLNTWSDLSPISSCTKINYLEIDDTNCCDLSPLSNLTSLEDLNVGNLGSNVSGWEALYNLKKLNRLWIGLKTLVPQDILLELRKELPDTKISTDNESSALGDWRWTDGGERNERYDRLFKEMGYYDYRSTISYFYNDPQYYPEGYIGSKKVINPEW